MKRMTIAVFGLAMFATAAMAANEATTVTATGQAAIYGTDVANARDKAIADAMRKAVEQAVGSMVSSETVTQNFELISDKIFAKSKGYVRNYKITKEGKEADGVYSVSIEAQVSAGDIKGDLDGILQVLRAKNMPRVLVMVTEQNIGQVAGVATSTSLNAVENTFMDSWQPKGVKFVDRQALQGKLSAGAGTTSMAEPSAAQLKEFSNMTGAEIVVIGQAVATDAGTIMGSQMHSVRANISVRALNPDTGAILATSTQTQAVGHIDTLTGGTQALQKVAQKAAEDLLGKILAQWQGSQASSIKLTLKNVGKSKFLRDIAEVLRNQVRGVADVRQRSFKSKVAELEIDIKGSAQDLAEELEDKKFTGFALEIEETTANTVVAVVK